MGPVLGIRASRSALIIEDGVISHFFKEAPKAFEVSDAESLLAIVSG
jgi:peroxiredoxin